MLTELFVIGPRAHGSREVVEALYARSAGRDRRPFARVIEPPEAPSERGLMLINDFAPRPKEGPEVLFRGPKREFVAHFCGDGFRAALRGERRACDGAVWVLSAERALDEALVDDVVSAHFCGAKRFVVFVKDARDRARAHACERFARAALDRAGLRGDERTVVFDTEHAGEDRWKQGIDQLIDALEAEIEYVVGGETATVMTVGSMTTAPMVRLGGMVRCGELRVGDEVALVRAGVRATVAGIQARFGVSAESVQAGRWADVELSGVDMRKVPMNEVIATPGALGLVRSARGTFCDLSDEPMPERINARGIAGSAAATARVSEARGERRRARQIELVFDEPTPWRDGDEALLSDPAGEEDDDARWPRWLAAFDSARSERPGDGVQ
jgi:hypothetical protein